MARIAQIVASGMSLRSQVWRPLNCGVEAVRREDFERFVPLLAPFAPHFAEELHELLGHKESLAYTPWPEYDEALCIDETLESLSR